MTANSRVDQALDQMQARTTSKGTAFDSFTVAMIARVLRVSNKHAGDMLQQHRLGQRRGRTRWIVAGESYGRAAHWNVLARPGADRVALRTARGQAALQSLQDGVRRVVKDFLCEVRAATQASGSTTANALIENVMNTAIATFEMQVRLAQSILASLP